MELFGRGGYAYFGTEMSFFPFDDIVSVDKFQEFVKSYGSFGLQQNSEFGLMFDYHLAKMFQSGIMQKLLKKWMYKTPRRDTFSSPAIGPKSLMVPAYVCLAGIALSILLSVIEKTFYKEIKNINKAF